MKLIIRKTDGGYTATTYRDGEEYVHMFPNFVMAMKFAIKYFGEDYTVIKEYWEADGAG